MFTEQQKKAKQSMQVKFTQHLQEFRNAVSIPEYKCIKDICLGILKTNSVTCTKIAGSLHEPITVKKVCERFTRHLNKESLGETLKETTLKTQCRHFDHNTAIIVDDSDIVKSKATKMEGQKKVRDGSTGKVNQLGYDLLNIISCQSTENGFELKPISSELLAMDIEQDSLAQITEDRIVDVALASGNKGVYVFDRAYDERKMFAFTKEHGLNYIIRSVGARGLIVNGMELNFKEVAKSVKLNYRYSLKNSSQHLKCGIKRVAVRLNPHPVKHPETAETWLVVAQFSKDEKGRRGYFYLVCDFPAEDNLGLNEIISKALSMYHLRWKIEEVHKHIKQAYAWEQIQLTSYTRLKNMNQLLLIAMCYLYSLKRFVARYLIAFPAIMKYKNKSWKKIYDFVYYRLSNLVETCFAWVTKYDIRPYKGVWGNNQQLILPCLKNGGM
jgi:hypothetical protein